MDNVMLMNGWNSFRTVKGYGMVRGLHDSNLIAVHCLNKDELRLAFLTLDSDFLSIRIGGVKAPIFLCDGVLMGNKSFNQLLRYLTTPEIGVRHANSQLVI
jgi:hypothetical protein